MSQQGSEGFLGESELPEQIHHYLELKFDKDDFLRPTKDVVIEIYTRFLDKTGYDWRRSKSFKQDVSIKAQMVHILKIIFSRYNIEYEFNLNDLISPTRKRTTTFLNVLLFVMASLEESLKYMQQRNAQYIEEQQELDETNRNIAQKRLMVEELALRIGQSLDVEEMRVKIEEGKQALEELSTKHAELTNIGSRIKNSNKEAIKFNQELEKEIQQVDRQIALQSEIEKLKIEESQLKDRLACAEATYAKFQLEADLRVSQVTSELHKNQIELGDIIKHARLTIQDLKSERENIREKREEITIRRKNKADEIKQLIENANKKLEVIKASYENSRTNSRKTEETLSIYKERVEALMFVAKPVLNETVKNSTFIKSRAAN